jgi:acyl dehydratase
MQHHAGTVLATHTLTARNTATASSNRMHDDTVARQLGFSGGLVPGADVWAYAAHPLVETWGLDWLANGAMELRFHAPFYDGDRVRVSVTAGDDQNTVRLAAVNDAGTLCAAGTATRSATAPPPDPAGIPAAPLPDWPPPRASAAHFESHPVLGTLEAPWSEDLAAAYLDAVGEQSPLLRDGAVAPPGWLARLSDFVLVANVTMGPWIFAQAQLRHLGLVHAGETVAVRARVAQVYERSGHRFVDLDLLMLTGDDRPVLCGRKTAIYAPRGA